MSAPVPPPIAPKSGSSKTNRVLGIVVIVVGAVMALAGVLQMIGSDTPYEAGRNKGKVTMGLLAAGAGAHIVSKNKP